MKTAKKDSVECYPFFLCINFYCASGYAKQGILLKELLPKRYKTTPNKSHFLTSKNSIIVRHSFLLRTPVAVLSYGSIIGNTAIKNSDINVTMTKTKSRNVFSFSLLIISLLCRRNNYRLWCHKVTTHPRYDPYFYLTDHRLSHLAMTLQNQSKILLWVKMLMFHH